LAAALASFTENGYDRTTVGDIRTRARATTGTLYHYFPGGKAEIAAALHVDCLRRYQEGAGSFLDGLGDDAEAGIRGGVRYHLRWIAAHPDRARFLLSDRPTEVRDAMRPAMHHLNRRLFGRLVGLLVQQKAAGRVVRGA